MPEKRTRRRATRARRQGKAATTQAGEYVREEMRHKRSGKHKVKNRKQAIAIGLSKARRSGVKVPRTGRRTARTSASQAARTGRSRTSSKRRGGTSRKSSRSSRSRKR